MILLRSFRRVNKKNIGMECDCSLSKDEIRRSVKGCGEDCLNKLLMIECDKACTLKNLCGNRRFQNVENAPTEVFKTHWKGIGLRATAGRSTNIQFPSLDDISEKLGLSSIN